MSDCKDILGRFNFTNKSDLEKQATLDSLLDKYQITIKQLKKKLHNTNPSLDAQLAYMLIREQYPSKDTAPASTSAVITGTVHDTVIKNYLEQFQPAMLKYECPEKFEDLIGSFIVFDVPVNRIEPFGREIYFREAYWTLIQRVYEGLNQSNPHSRTNSIILGTPGIGKSCFAPILIMYFLRVLGWSVQFCCKNYPCVTFTPANPYTNTLILYDSKVDAAPIDFAVLITSPNDATRNKFEKLRTQRLYMPLFTKNELLALKDRFYGDMPYEDFDRALTRFGPIPRTMFLTLPDTRESNLQTAISEINDFEKILESLEHSTLNRQIFHLVVHLVASDDCMNFTIRFSTYEIAQLFAVAHERDNMRFVKKFLQSALATQAPKYSYSILFENFCHMRLCSTEIFPLKPLYKLNAAAEPLASVGAGEMSAEAGGIPAHIYPRDGKAKHLIQHFDEKMITPQTLTANTYYAFGDHNFPSIDSISGNNDLIQITLGKNKQNQSATGLIRVFTRFENYESIGWRIIYVITDVNANHFDKWQSFHFTDDIPPTMRDFIEQIPQFTLCLSVSSRNAAGPAWAAEASDSSGDEAGSAPAPTKRPQRRSRGRGRGRDRGLASAQLPLPRSSPPRRLRMRPRRLSAEGEKMLSVVRDSEEKDDESSSSVSDEGSNGGNSDSSISWQ